MEPIVEMGLNNNNDMDKKDEQHTPGVADESGWQKVEKKRSFVHSPSPSVEESPSPLDTFKGLMKVDEIDAIRGKARKLTQSQKKKQKHKGNGAGGKFSPRFT